MSVKPYKGKWVIRWVNKKASTAFSKESLCDLIAGYVNPSSANSGAANKPVLGIYQGPTISSATTGKYLYSNTAEVPVLVPASPRASMLMDTTGTDLAITDQGNRFDMSTALLVDTDANTNGAVRCIKYLSTSKGVFEISRGTNVSGTV